MVTVNALPGCLTAPATLQHQDLDKDLGMCCHRPAPDFSLNPLKELCCWHLSSLCLSFPACRLEFQLLLVLFDLMSPSSGCSKYW